MLDLPMLEDVPGGPSRLGERDWTLAVLPDSQCLVESWPQHFAAQTRWLVEARERYRICAVVHVGDIVDDNPDAAQWERAGRALHALDGQLPYVLALGNHDMGRGTWADSRETRLNDLFDAADRAAFPALVETFEPGCLESSAHVIDTPAGPHLLLALEFGPRAAVVAWARRVLARHRALPAVLVTHAYLYNDGTRYDRKSRREQRWSPYGYGVAKLPGGVADGEELWRMLVAPSGNARLVLSGHVLDGRARLSSRASDGRVVHQVVSNYQELPEGGQGHLRLMTFRPDAGTLEVRTYSPVLDVWLTDARDRFVLTG